ncbi:MAG: hypothetical protein BWY34_00064 [Parcubacteria group bacterium ADurb.Bin247]|jgi:uncharacterized protein YxeA|nr:MAG: hypothetical protein BWY34_00064 [Parcubacteria group bacterium ADurb.Bin247]HQB85282.1 hypothetical protein [Candidatus Pacearchaeota archaeon]
MKRILIIILIAVIILGYYHLNPDEVNNYINISIEKLKTALKGDMHRVFEKIKEVWYTSHNDTLPKFEI